MPRRGIFIVRKTKQQIIEMIEMWAALESMAARLATVNASDEEIAALRTMFDEFRNATPADHIQEYSDANIAFHQAIIRLSGSHLMGKTIENLFIHVRAIRRHDDLAERPRGALDRRPHADHRGAREAATPSSPSAWCASTRSTSPRTSTSTAISWTEATHDDRIPVDRRHRHVARWASAAGRGTARRAAPVDADALAEIAALLGDAPRERDLLIEYLHRIQDALRLHLPAAHIVALAQEMKLAMTEVYEVATFYHHFDVVEGRRSAAAAA